ncbi:MULTISPECIES: TIR domain-containing protein [Fusobacterium]|jgi:hypothetical protein|uniref:TIR domain-containing protein n=1 Tax=Fusobacterium TaxID=848 RepID=UPI0022E8830D|nr:MULTISPECIES: hypothetical protein [Fusobacterium]
MENRTGNYTAFYVKEPFKETNLGAHSSYDFCYYNMLRMWKGQNSSFPFVDSHGKTYSVRDDSTWETLKSRLRKRLNLSKNIILFLSNYTIESDALKEELEYGIGYLGLPVIVIYPDYYEKTDVADNNGFKEDIKKLWNKVPTFKKYKNTIPVIHIPLKRSLIESALTNSNFRINYKNKIDNFYFL